MRVVKEPELAERRALRAKLGLDFDRKVEARRIEQRIDALLDRYLELIDEL